MTFFSPCVSEEYEKKKWIKKNGKKNFVWKIFFIEIGAKKNWLNFFQNYFVLGGLCPPKLPVCVGGFPRHTPY